MYTLLLILNVMVRTMTLAYTLPVLPYAADALEPAMSEETVQQIEFILD